MATKQRSGVKRRVDSRQIDGYVVTLYPDGVKVRPVRARKEDAEVYASWDQIYLRAMIKRVPAIEKRKRSRGSRAT